VELVERDCPLSHLKGTAGELHAALENGAPTRIKTMLQALTDEIRVDARDAIEPIFRVPAIRPPSNQYRQRDSNPCYRRERAAS
jgi:hypothetical protein